MCLVEILKTPKPVASCAMPVMEGMTIYTHTPLVKKAREAVLEFLLLNHPLDCPICDQGGECDLQDQAVVFGSDSSRFFETKRGVENKNCGPLIKGIMTRCIHCTRCVRFATEMAGVDDLGVTGRGRATEIGTYVEKAFQSELSGNLIDLCPVGALTSKTYAFLSRPWELESNSSIDLSDALGSNILLHSRGAEILRVLPRFHEQINEEWLTDKARFSYDGLKYQRLNQPFLKKEGKLRVCTWEEALIKGSQHLSLHDGADLQGFVGESLDAYSTLSLRDLFSTLGSPHLSQEQGFHGVDIGLRKNYTFHRTLAKIEESDLCLLVGVNTRYEASMLNLRLRKRSLEGNFTVASIGSPIDLTFDHQHLGTSLATLQHIVEGKHPFTKNIAQANNPVVIVGSTLFEKEGAEALSRMLDGLPFHILPSGANVVGQKDLGLAHKVLPTSRKVVYLLGTDQMEVSGKGFIIYQGHHGDINASRADLILPGAAFTEKRGIYVNIEGRPQETMAALSPPGLAREDWRIVKALGIFMNHSYAHVYSQDMMLDNRLAKLSPSFERKDEVLECTLKSSKPKTSVSSFIVPRIPLREKILDFYKSNAITRASRIMATCSSFYKKRSNFPF